MYALAPLERLHFGVVNIESEDFEAFFRKGQREREPDVAHADDADLGIVVVYAVEEILGSFVHFRFQVKS